MVRVHGPTRGHVYRISRFDLGHRIRCESTEYKRSKGVRLFKASEKTLRPFLTASAESDKDPGNAAIKPGKCGFI